MIILFYKEKYYRNEELHKELDRIKTLIKKPKSQPDIYTPTAKEVLKSLKKLREINSKIAQFYLGLALSGVRIVELEYAVKSYGLREINNNDEDNDKNSFYKIIVNKSRNTKNSYFIYLPSWFRLPETVSLDYLIRLLHKHKDIIRPKHLRNFFYSACIEIGISTAIADFYQGRTPITIGNKHYLQTEHHADREYKRLVEYFRRLGFDRFIKNTPSKNNTMIRLELPNIKFKETYLNAVKEFIEKGSDNESTDHYLKQSLEELDSSFEDFVNTLDNKSKGINLQEGRVAGTEFWMIDENDKYCGRISLRHSLNEALAKHGGHIGYDIIPSERGKGYATKSLSLCLDEAKKKGIFEVLVTCDDDNIPSLKTIERNGGVLRDKIEHNGILSRRYDIKLK